MQVPTIKIEDDNKRGFKTINKSDFDSKKQKEYSDEVKKTPKELLTEEAISLEIDVTELTTNALLKEAIAEAKKTKE